MQKREIPFLRLSYRPVPPLAGAQLTAAACVMENLTRIAKLGTAQIIRLSGSLPYSLVGYFFIGHVAGSAPEKGKTPQSLAALRDFRGGDCWTRTSDLLRVKQAL